MLVRFLSPTSDATQESLLELGAERKLLVVDDAHERNDLGACCSNTSRTLRTTPCYCFRTEPTGLRTLSDRPGVSRWSDNERVTVELAALKKKDAVALARQVLKERNGPEAAAEDIAAPHA